ncbi:hypothetical protein ASD8599_03441 [Ascidiaceihabitans donghaensis]|uniref:Flp pilus assembly protein TadG n=1 Tax=Ascidiaceihabitans donghaensis TaxID=1510460 RepID=A0A2R8BHZ7_9RHOB|nr:hypothetical protein [Ascidiaceihabitans donghaensis]SPH22696.1 hypothetical protein ASD8599_03441 [Ascidiaceihabitans donghaensis]
MRKMNLKQKMRFYAARFGRDEEASIAVETVIILPALFWAYLTMFSIFHAYRQHTVNLRAAFTIGDMISRETAYLDSAYMNGAQDLLTYLTAAEESDTAIRITSVKYDANNNVYKRDWSKKRGWVSALGNNAVKKLKDRLPIMKHNERVMLVETWVKYNPPFDTGLSDHEIVNFVFTRPRYAPQVLWDPSSGS